MSEQSNITLLYTQYYNLTYNWISVSFTLSQLPILATKNNYLQKIEREPSKII